jgi:1,2-diacylglycerol 3-alpha-glucosyltransferase
VVRVKTEKRLTAAILFWRFGPYHLARLKAASRVCDLCAVELSAAETTYGWDPVTEEAGYRRFTLFDHYRGGASQKAECRRRMASLLTELRPTVVAVPGWSFPDALSALAWCTRNHTPAVLMSESGEQDEPRRWWKEIPKRALMTLFGSALVGGRLHKDYLAKLGMERTAVFFGYDAVDNDYFTAAAEQIRSVRMAALKQNKLPDHYFLASARFVEKKNLERLLAAYAAYRTSSKTIWDLVIVGDGPLRERLETQRERLRLTNQVHLVGFKQYHELPNYYGLAEAFLHVSMSEQWGLVVNEAMASSLPVIVSNRCGCAPELVRNGCNGYLCDPYSVEDLAGCMLRMANPRTDRLAMGRESLRIVQDFGPERFGSGLLAATEYALRHAARPNIAGRLALAGLLR